MKAIFISSFLMIYMLSVNAQSASYLVDFRQSDIIWNAKKVGGEHKGNVKFKSGSFTVENGMISKGEFVVDMNSITNSDITDEATNKTLVGHLKSADFFETDKYPETKMVITGSEKSDGEFYTAKGNLTIKDVTLPFTFRYVFKYDNSVFVAMSNMQVDRAKFNVKYGSESFFKNLGDKVIYDLFDLQVKLIGKPL